MSQTLIDADGHLWSLTPEQEILVDGANAYGRGSDFVLCGRSVLVLGWDGAWWRWGGFLGAWGAPGTGQWERLGEAIHPCTLLVGGGVEVPVTLPPLAAGLSTSTMLLAGGAVLAFVMFSKKGKS